MGFFKKIKDKIESKKKNQFIKDNERYYKIVIGIILTMYVFIFALSMANPNEGKYLSTENGHVIKGESSSQFKVINRYYDKEAKRYQVIVWLVGDGTAQEDYQTELTAESLVKTEVDHTKKSQVTRIGRHYFSIVVSNVPENYEAIRTDIHVKRVSIGDNETLKSDIKLYSKESQTTNQTVKLSEEFFKEQALETQLNEINLEIADIEKKNQSLKKDINKLTQLIEKIENDMALQLTEEQEESRRVIENYRGEIAQKENNITENLQRIDELEESKQHVDSLF